jgi:prefoldin subunit 5
MKRAALATVLLLASSLAQAHANENDKHLSCEISSDYSVSSYRNAYVFTQDQGKPAEIGIGGGRLFLDGKEATLSDADHQRLRQMEAEMKALMPEVQQITVEAIDIAFTALTEVARGLASDPHKTVSKLESAHARVLKEMSDKPLALFNDDAMGDVVEPIMADYVPEIVGSAVTTALKAVFSGEKKRNEFEARMEHMQQELDTKVDARAKALEPLAQAMCQRLRRIDDIDNALEYRLPDAKPLQLLQVERREKTDAP